MFTIRKLSHRSLPLISQGQRCRQLPKILGGKISPGVDTLLTLHTTKAISVGSKELQPTPKELQLRDRHFQNREVKTKDSFLQMIDSYNQHDKVKRGHIEFIYAALNAMAEYGVEGDIEVYKKLMDVFPKGKMIPKNLIQAEFMHFGRHQACGVFLLDHMEHQGVCPDPEMKEIILATFGKSTVVYKKYSRMLYWMPKLRNLNPYLMPDPMPTDVRELARLALGKMARDKRTRIQEYTTEVLEGASDRTWIMSAQSPAQQKLIEEHPESRALYVEGPTLVWLRKISITYFVLRADPKIYPPYEVDDDDLANLSIDMFGEPKQIELTLVPQSIHEQEEGVVLALCCTGTSSKDSLLSWVRFLARTNPKLEGIPVLFKLKTSPSTMVAVNSGREEAEGEASEALKAEKETLTEEDVNEALKGKAEKDGPPEGQRT